MGSAVFSTPGTYTWSAPSRVYWVVGELWGAGGSAQNNGSLAGGGGGGAYVKTKFVVSPGFSYEIIVGEPFATSGAAPFPAGGFSSIEGITTIGLKAKAVGGGAGWSSFPSTNGLGGQASSCTPSSGGGTFMGVTTIVSSGGDGAEGTNTDGGGGGAAGNSGGVGANASGTTGGVGANGGGSGGNGGAGAAGQAGFAPGGGAGANGSGGGIGGKLGGDGYVSITWGDPPAITSANNVTFALGLFNTFTVTTTGDPTIVITRTAGVLPPGVTFVDNGDGTATISGTPTSMGAYVSDLKAQNFTGYHEQLNFTLTVSQPPAITSANNVTFTTGVFGTFTVTTTGNPTVSTIVRGGASLPAAVTFVDNGNGTGTLSGTPGAATGGTYAINFTASNGVNPDAFQSFTLTVNQAPAITSANNTTFTIGAFGTFTVTTTGYPIPSISISSGSLPTGVTFVDNGNNTATISGTPGVGTSGVYNLVFTANNGVSPNATQNFTLTVNQAPAITSANTVVFTIGVSGSFTVTTTGYPVPSISIFSGSLPSGIGFIDNGNGTATLSGTPAPGTAGTWILVFNATNSISPDANQNFNLIISNSGGGGGDPHFMGFDGVLFDFHGKQGSCYNLYKDSIVSVNAKFIKIKNQTFIGKVSLAVADKKIVIASDNISPFIIMLKHSSRKNSLPRALHFIKGDMTDSYLLKLPHGNIVVSRTILNDIKHLNVMINIYSKKAGGIIGQTLSKKRRPNEAFEINIKFI